MRLGLIIRIKNPDSKCRECANKDTAKNNTTHNASNHKLYRIHHAMKNRCLNKSYKGFEDYGERGISICDSWRYDFLSFFKWAINNGYKDGLTIDRIDNDGDYEPSNCRWVDKNIQSRNTRKLSKKNTSGFRGVTYCKKTDRWIAQIVINNKQIHLGRFDYPYAAGYIYDSYVLNNNLEHTRNFV